MNYTCRLEVGMCFNSCMYQEDVGDSASRARVLYQVALTRIINLKQGMCGYCTVVYPVLPIEQVMIKEKDGLYNQTKYTQSERNWKKIICRTMGKCNIQCVL